MDQELYSMLQFVQNSTSSSFDELSAIKDVGLPKTNFAAVVSQQETTKFCESFQELFNVDYNIEYKHDLSELHTDIGILEQNDQVSAHIDHILTEENVSIAELAAYLQSSSESFLQSVTPEVESDLHTTYYYQPMEFQTNNCVGQGPDFAEQTLYDTQSIVPEYQNVPGELNIPDINVSICITNFERLLPNTFPSTEHHEFPRKTSRRKAHMKPAVIGKWQCIPCGRMFRLERGLIHHNRSQHSGPKPYSCSICGKRYHDEQTKQKHQQRHLIVDKPHKCAHCPKQYLYPNDLKRHTDLHHGVAKYICKFCGMAFDRNDHVKDHETSHENGTIKRKRKNKAINAGCKS